MRYNAARWATYALIFFIGVLLVVVGGCAELTAAQKEQAEYEYVEWLETEFKPMVEACRRMPNAYLYYSGPANGRLAHALDSGDYTGLRRVDLQGVRCVADSWQ